MSYLKEFLTQINQKDFHKFFILWEEYCTCDTVEAEEFSQLLKAVKSSPEMVKHFGEILETAIPLWKSIKNEEESYEVLRLLVDLQTTNNPQLADFALDALKKKHGHDPKFDQRLRYAGLRNKDQFQGALSKYDLLAHMSKNNIVFHTGGWGTGEIIDVSTVREHLVIEFENVSGRKDMSFSNAFKTLIPLPSTHFLARRFSDPDLLEKEGKQDPVGLIKLFLRDMGPKTAAEIKDELCELVIPEAEWTKWWQGARAKIKKDPMIETPETLKEPFYLRKAELSPEERIKNVIQNKVEPAEIIQATYSFVRDTPAALKNPETKKTLQDKLLQLLDSPQITHNQALQILLLLEQFFNYTKKESQLVQEIKKSENIEEIIKSIEIVALKKRVLIAVKESRPDWIPLFLALLFSSPQAQIRDYILKELNKGEPRKQLEKKLKELLQKPSIAPEAFLWYFQKVVSEGSEAIPYQNKEGQCQFFESFLLLFNQLETQPSYKELLKKMYNLLSGNRYALVRQILQGTTLEFTKEFLLLASKCQSLTDHDKKILLSLAEVVHPSLAAVKKTKGVSEDNEIIWTTEEGYLKTKERVIQIGTVEIIENAKEIEAARALGDLRENSEFKFAQERRARLQSELKSLSQQLNRAQIINKNDIDTQAVGVGCIVEVKDKDGAKTTYTLLGPWDANPENNILSLNSKFAQAMVGKKVGDKFSFKDETYQIVKLGSFL